MVPFNGDDGDALLFKPFETFDGMQQRLGIDGAFIKQIARDNHKVNGALLRLAHDIPEGAAKIVEPLTHAILIIAEVRISYMNKRSSHQSPHVMFVCTKMVARTANSQARSSNRGSR